MPRIDYYVRSLERFGATSIVLASATNVTLRFPTGDRYASQNTSHADVVALVEEIASAPLLQSLHQGVPGVIRHDCFGKSFEIRVEPEATSWRVVIEALVVSAAAVAAPAVAAAAGGRAHAYSSTHSHSPSHSPAHSPSHSSSPSIDASPPVAAASTPAAARRPANAVAIGHVPLVSAPRAPAPEAVVAETSRPLAAVASASRVVDQMLIRMQELGASDLHLSSGSPPSVRLHGEIRPLAGFSFASPEELRGHLFEVAPEKNRREFEERNDTDFAHMLPGVARFRANFFMDRHGPAAVFRSIPFRILTPEQLGIPPGVLQLCELNKGLVVVTGPTGSGKSTTLATLIDHINKTRSDHIITVEDPIEFLHDSKRCLVHQREVHSHTRTFKDALRAALREDPDIVLVGEMRDLETVAMAIETAETGHLVFGTLHTNTAPSTVDRIIDQFSADRQDQIRQMLAESLRGVVAQTLCKKIGGGRVAAYEVLIGSSAVSNLIRERKTFQIFSLMQTGRGQGMVTLNDSLLDLVRRKQIEPREAYLKAVQKGDLKKELAREGISVDAAD